MNFFFSVKYFTQDAGTTGCNIYCPVFQKKADDNQQLETTKTKCLHKRTQPFGQVEYKNQKYIPLGKI